MITYVWRRRTKTKKTNHIQDTQSAMITYVWRRRTKTKKTNHIQDTHNQLWSPMSEGGEQKPKRLIIYKTHTITRHTQSAMITYVWRRRTKTKKTNHIQDTQSAMITYVWRRRTKTKKTNHIQDTHNQLWSPMSEGGEQKPKRLIIYKTHTISYDHLCLKEENKN